jgi:hypothetical protein
MPLHNTRGNARGPNNRIKRASSDLGAIEAFKNAKSRLFKVVTRNFYNAHVASVDSPNLPDVRGRNLGLQVNVV